MCCLSTFQNIVGLLNSLRKTNLVWRFSNQAKTFRFLVGQISFGSKFSFFFFVVLVVLLQNISSSKGLCSVGQISFGKSYEISLWSVDISVYHLEPTQLGFSLGKSSFSLGNISSCSCNSIVSAVGNFISKFLLGEIPPS